MREAAENFSEPRIVAIALDTKGPEIRTGLLAGVHFVCTHFDDYLQGASAEIELKKGDSIRLTTDNHFENSGTAVNLYIDYKNITKVVNIGSKIYIDDGLIMLIVDEIGLFKSNSY